MDITSEYLEFEKLIVVSDDDKALRHIDRLCEEKGHTEEVDSKHYQEFIEMSDEEISAVMRFFIYSRADGVNTMLAKDAPDEDFINLVIKMLQLMARGRLWCGEDFNVVYAKPIGPAPTAKEWDAINQRIGAARHLIGAAYLECGKTSSEKDDCPSS